MKRPSRFAWCVLFLSAILPGLETRAAEPERFDALATAYAGETRPLLAEFCLGCHSTAAREGELDLERFAALADVRAEPRVWQKVVEMLDNGEMPPKDEPQPSEEQRRSLRTWVGDYLDAEARAQAGDPGPVVLRRLSNVEYTLTVRDLTGVDLRPAREFPADGAAGEGFTNAGEALVMSPALLEKYLAAAKEIAGHAVPLPDGMRFSPRVGRRDWTNELVEEIGAIYARYTDDEGRIPLERYLLATIERRNQLAADEASFGQVAAERGLSEKYLRILWDALHGSSKSLLLGPLSADWRRAESADAARLAAAIRERQQSLWQFNNVGHFKERQVPVSPLPTSVSLAQPLEAAGETVVVSLVARDAGDGNEGDFVVWRRPRLEGAGRPPLSLRDVRAIAPRLKGFVDEVLADTEAYLAAVAEIDAAAQNDAVGDAPPDLAAVAAAHGVEAEVLRQWLAYLGIAGGESIAADAHMDRPMTSVGGHAFANGWGWPETPLLVANASDTAVNIPGTLAPHAVVVHPSPDQFVAVGWQSPLDGTVRIAAAVEHAHAACGNGVSWSLEMRRGGWRRQLAGGTIDVGGKAEIPAFEDIPVRVGDLVSLVIGARDGNHGCDLTRVELLIEGADRAWSLSEDVAGDVLAGNPHADRFGNAAIWHFYRGPEGSAPAATDFPVGSAVAEWRAALSDPAERDRLGELGRAIAVLLSGETPPADDSPNGSLRAALLALDGPLFGRIDYALVLKDREPAPGDEAADAFGLPAERFGPTPEVPEATANDFVVRAPAAIEVRLPAALARGRSLVVDGTLAAEAGREGTVQLEVRVLSPAEAAQAAPQPAAANPEAESAGSPNSPVVTHPSGGARARVEASYEEFRRLFPPFVCYRRIVPVDEVVTLVQFHRDDEPLARLLLDEAESARLDRLWTELRYISQDALKVREAYVQFMEYVTQDGIPANFEPLREPIRRRAEALEGLLAETEPRHLDALLEFAARAYRRPLAGSERDSLLGLYRRLREEEFPHDDALRLTLARVLVAPSFLYRVEQSAAGEEPQPVSDWELAGRLSYFLWSSLPDDELRKVAADGRLREPDALNEQTRRMLRDDRVRALATEFACQWLGVREFDVFDEKSEQVFPEFAGLRGAMYEESVRFFADWFQRDGSFDELLNADHAFLNDALAQYYGIAGVDGPEWRRVEDIRRHGRGGILGMASVLAKQSGASRTSPVLRGNWVLESLLGEKLPKPPKDVPLLPEQEAEGELTVRQLVERHREVASCAKCHDRIDPLGFALEEYDAIGRLRSVDLAGRPVDAVAELTTGERFAGLDGLRDYLWTQRREQFAGQFCRKLLGYALGRGVQLSDEPLLAEMSARLLAEDGRVTNAIEAIVQSRQFRYARGLEATREE